MFRRIRPAVPAVAVLAAAILWAGGPGLARANRPSRGASAAPSPSPVRAPDSRSIGLPWQGRLQGGVLLRPGASLRYISRRPPERHFYGTVELVRAIEAAAARVATEHPGAQLVVGDLGKRSGGDIHSHASHETGRDVDLAFYMLDARGRQFVARSFLRVNADGTVPGARGVRFDAARNWALVAALLENEGTASVQYIFCSLEIRALLLQEAHRVRAPAPLVSKAAMVLVQPSNSSPHRDHFHVRIYCPAGDRPECEDVEPFWPSLAELGGRRVASRR